MQPTPPQSSEQISDLIGDYRLRGPNLEEMLDLKDKEISRLRARIEELESEKQEMVENFQISSGLMIERLKTLEAQLAGSDQRPMTANVLGRLGEGSSEPLQMNAAGWGGASFEEFQARPGNQTPPRIKEVDPYALKRESKALDLQPTKRIWGSSKVPESEMEESKENRRPTNAAQKAAQTAMFYRKASKCKICGELMLLNQKTEHLAKYRSEKKLREAITGMGELKTLDLMLGHGFDINSKLERGNTAIHIAVEEGTHQMVLDLVGRAANVDISNENGSTPLMVACELGKHQMVKSLVELGASLQIKDKNLRTPLMIACKNGDLDLCKYLIKQEVDIHATNSIGDNCLGIAQRSGNQQIVMLLLQNGASLRKKKLF